MTRSTLVFFTLSITFLTSSIVQAQYDYEPSDKYPFGRLSPEAPSELADFDPLIGLSECSSEIRNPDGSWNPPITMHWKWKYVMNGNAVQDETLSENGIHAGSIRQFNADSSAWYVHFYSSNSSPSTLPSWKGGKKGDNSIILYRPQVAPNGMEGFYKINFIDITEESFEWRGQWVNPDESIIYPTWNISCTKIES